MGTTSPSPHHRAVQQSTELARSGVIAPRAKQRPTRWCAKAYHGPPRVKPRKGAVRERQKGLVTREDRAAHDRGRTTKGEVMLQGHYYAAPRVTQRKEPRREEQKPYDIGKLCPPVLCVSTSGH